MSDMRKIMQRLDEVFYFSGGTGGPTPGPSDESSRFAHSAALSTDGDAQPKVRKIDSIEKAEHYLRGTKSSLRDPRMFNQYINRGPIFFVVPSKKNRPGERYIIQPSIGVYTDENDNSLSADEFYARFPSLQQNNPVL